MLKKNIIANYIGQFYVIIIGIVMVPFYLKYLGAEAYGLVGFFGLMHSWIALLDMGLSPTLSREVAKIKATSDAIKKLEFIKLVHSLEFIFMIISIIIFISILLSSHWISLNWLNVQTLNLTDVAYCISLMGTMMAIRFMVSLYASGIRGAEEQVWINKINSIAVTFKFIGVLFILHFISTDIVHFFEYQMLIEVLLFVVYFKMFYKTLSLGKVVIYFSTIAVKPILPFALGLAYTSAIWIFLTQLDKLLLSGLLQLNEYGYFALVGMITNAIIQIIAPIGNAILPRMTNLLSQNKTSEMLLVYKKSTQLMAVFIFSVVAIVSAYSYELFYAWTGNIEASIWAENILFWYVLGNGILAMASFQYYLQFAYGNLKLHVRYNTLLALISIPLIVWSAYTYGALGVAITWFILRFIAFFTWTPYVHHIFVPGIYKNWMLKDIAPIFISTISYIMVLKYIDFSFDYDRMVIFIILLFMGIVLLTLNSFVSSEGRKMIIIFMNSKFQ